MRRDVFQAIADPTRRDIIKLIASQPQTVNAVADTFSISRQAVSKHLKILTECGLVSVTQEGRERYCEAKLKSLNEVSVWVDQYRKHWEARFDALDEYLTSLQSKKKRQTGKRAKGKRK